MHKEHYAELSDIHETTYSGTKCFVCDIKSPKVECKGSSCTATLSLSYDFSDIKKALNKLGWVKVQVKDDGIYGICPKCVKDIKKLKTK